MQSKTKYDKITESSLTHRKLIEKSGEMKLMNGTWTRNSK